MAILFMGPLGNDRDDWGKGLTAHRIGHLIYLITELLLSQRHLLLSILVGHKYLHIFCPFGEIYPYASSPDVFITNFPIMRFLSTDH